MMKTYLIPTVFTTDNKFPMEYKVVTRKRDMRTKFCKNHESNIIDRDTLDEFIKNLGAGLVNLLNIVLVDAIVLGGAISNQKSALTTPLEQYINSHIYAKCTGKKVKCKISKFKN